MPEIDLEDRPFTNAVEGADRLVAVAVAGSAPMFDGRAMEVTLLPATKGPSVLYICMRCMLDAHLSWLLRADVAATVDRSEGIRLSSRDGPRGVLVAPSLFSHFFGGMQFTGGGMASTDNVSSDLASKVRWRHCETVYDERSMC
jgi:hypothetical protein